MSESQPKPPSTGEASSHPLSSPVAQNNDSESHEMLAVNAAAPVPVSSQQTSASSTAAPPPTSAVAGSSSAPPSSEIQPAVGSEPVGSKGKSKMAATSSNDGIEETPAVAASITGGNAANPSISLILLTASGSRHPYRVDRKYLKRRNVQVEDDHPDNVSVYQLKELILQDWRDEWDAKPTSPDYIRLITFGRLLENNTPLSDCRFKEDEPNVVHLNVRPQEILDEEDAKQAKNLASDASTRRSCNCCVIL